MIYVITADSIVNCCIADSVSRAEFAAGCLLALTMSSGWFIESTGTFHTLGPMLVMRELQNGRRVCSEVRRSDVLVFSDSF